ncbi:hypothetical protein GQX73_g6720 [Xylaria multiplex]|uniref:Uncharacterized protein n=1 Tax=Xylaria multiplex TaxID=323545 RepID=A0A7C8MVY1_9PEZI|nr:hypothetical protein GQX73_g6720 [Xylaria multiplex]
MHQNTRMHTLLYCLAAIAGISNIPATLAAESEDSIQLLQATGRYGPWQVPRAEFDTFLANHPNATGNYAIMGPNISASAESPFSGNESAIDGWSWSIVVSADLPLINTTWVPEDDGKGPFYYTGGKMTLNAPSSLLGPGGNLTVDDGWELCLFTWQIDDFPYSDKLRSDNGTCKSVLSDECIAEMKLAAASATVEGSCSCPIASSLPSCSRLGDAAKVFNNNCYGSPRNATDIRRWKEGKLETYAFGDATAHHLGNNTAYNNIGSLAFPALISFRNKDDINGVTDGSMTSLSCVRAVDAVAGSTVPGDAESSGNRLGTGAMTGIALALYGLWTLIL